MISLTSMPLRSNNTTPVPYQPGKSLQLQVLRSCCNLPFSQSVTAIISKTFDITMSPVMDVTINTESGSNFRAVLKLYDRRFGTDLRSIRGEHAPHTAADEAVFQSFVRQGKMGPFLRELEEEMKTALISPKASHLYDGTPEGSAKYEAALWQECNDYFDCETEAYARLRDLQGRSIPRMYAHVCLAPRSSDAPPDLLQSQTARYLEVKGVLLELIPGYSLWDLPTSPLAPPDPKKTWPAIVQSAVDAAHDINRRGVIMKDCGPRNVVVDERSQTPFIIDLAQCCFRDKATEAWEKTREPGEEDEDWDPDVEYWERVMGFDNAGAIGAVMTTLLLQTKGMKLDIKYPDRRHQTP
ncbi:hypothetical protein QBC46DRAFT_380915 [Diplogelasinospora grovesii]|uniref:Protein kinase domain-containing protein n=1 Tax=Diplogelasinospora grovesii TaxID=303347 RepID=A0AAN6ND22_9PEZI|nr:hypothetical protein QBC46DRAFT_380915 [Diplogelasinospora grovesii]